MAKQPIANDISDVFRREEAYVKRIARISSCGFMRIVMILPSCSGSVRVYMTTDTGELYCVTVPRDALESPSKFRKAATSKLGFPPRHATEIAARKMVGPVWRGEVGFAVDAGKHYCDYCANGFPDWIDLGDK